jgi:hypothetical protein
MHRYLYFAVSCFAILVNFAPSHLVDFALDRFGRFCEPNHVTVEQVTDIFCAFLRDVPERRSEPATFLFLDAMKRAWPCRKSQIEYPMIRIITFLLSALLLFTTPAYAAPHTGVQIESSLLGFA